MIVQLASFNHTLECHLAYLALSVNTRVIKEVQVALHVMLASLQIKMERPTASCAKMELQHTHLEQANVLHAFLENLEKVVIVMIVRATRSRLLRIRQSVKSARTANFLYRLKLPAQCVV